MCYNCNRLPVSVFLSADNNGYRASHHQVMWKKSCKNKKVARLDKKWLPAIANRHHLNVIVHFQIIADQVHVCDSSRKNDINLIFFFQWTAQPPYLNLIEQYFGDDGAWDIHSTFFWKSEELLQRYLVNVSCKMLPVWIHTYWNSGCSVGEQHPPGAIGTI